MARREHRRVVLRLYPEYEPDKKIMNWLDRQEDGVRGNVLSQRLIELLVEAIEQTMDGMSTKKTAEPSVEKSEESAVAVVEQAQKKQGFDGIPTASLLKKGLFK